MTWLLLHMLPNNNYLADVLRQKTLLHNLSLPEWNVIIRQARSANLLAFLYQVANDLDVLVDRKPYLHLEAAAVIANKQKQALLYETQQILLALKKVNIDLVMLKGAAYYLSELPGARGRLMSDIDILVPKESLFEVEKALMMSGWMAQHQDDYDARYYRQWMHEIPPMVQTKRQATLDIHHTILPPTARYKPDPKKILAAIREVKPGVYVLSPQDMVIHSATHLFHEGEFDHGLRDLVDIDGLLSEFGNKGPNFWAQLVPRALELDLIRPLYYALHYAQHILGTTIPSEAMFEVGQGAPNAMMGRVMDFLFLRALAPDHPTCDRPFTGLARWLLYVRSHYLRMPLYLLVPHLVRKAWKSRFEKKEAEPVLPEKG